MSRTPCLNDHTIGDIGVNVTMHVAVTRGSLACYRMSNFLLSSFMMGNLNLNMYAVLHETAMEERTVLWDKRTQL